VLAQHERELISSRTRAALQAKIEQGHRLGTPANLDEAAKQKGLAVRQQNAASNKQNRQAIKLIRIYRAQGHTFQQIADELNESGYTTRTGKPFYKGTIYYLLNSVEEAQTEGSGKLELKTSS
jgi:DNA invertase Pin-like site-specific DNA recombinase